MTKNANDDVEAAAAAAPNHADRPGTPTLRVQVLEYLRSHSKARPSEVSAALHAPLPDVVRAMNELLTDRLISRRA